MSHPLLNKIAELVSAHEADEAKAPKTGPSPQAPTCPHCGGPIDSKASDGLTKGPSLDSEKVDAMNAAFDGKKSKKK